MVEGRASCDEPPTRRKNVLGRSDDQFVDNASSYINSLDNLDSLHFSSDVEQCTSKAMDLQRLRLLQQLYEAHRLNVQNQIVIAQILFDRQRRRRPRPRRYWVKPWLSRRLDYGHYDRLMRELEAEDVVSFKNFVRMDPAMFREVYRGWGPELRNMTHGSGSLSTLDADLQSHFVSWPLERSTGV